MAGMAEMIAHALRFCDKRIAHVHRSPGQSVRRGTFWLPSLLLLSVAQAQQPEPVPDIATLMHQVQAHQRAMDQTRENYTFREHQTVKEFDHSGRLKKTVQRDSDITFVNSHEISRLVARDGHQLAQDEQKKEDERVNKDVEKAEHTPPGEMMDEKSELSVSRLLTIENFSNGRRVMMENRPVLAFDFAGNPDAKTHGMAEAASKRLHGTIWIDERDKQVRRVQATLEDTFRAGFGLFALNKGSSFAFDQKLINNELWLPTSATFHLEAKAMAFLGYHVDVQVAYDGYQRFHTATEQVSGSAASH